MKLIGDRRNQRADQRGQRQGERASVQHDRAGNRQVRINRSEECLRNQRQSKSQHGASGQGHGRSLSGLCIGVIEHQSKQCNPHGNYKPQQSRFIAHKCSALEPRCTQQAKIKCPQPPCGPRLEQNTRCPRSRCPVAVNRSLPKERLCRFKVPTQPQCGQGDCLREKVARSTPENRAQNEKANGTSVLAARTQPGPSSVFDGAGDGGTRLRRVRKKEGRHLTALCPH